MPRPCKRRRICAMPQQRGLLPLPDTRRPREIVTMTLDEYEAIRLIDFEGLSQEQCAESMTVARTTAQAIYASARHKLAACLVEGRELRIAGRDFVLCEGPEHGCGCPRCCGRSCQGIGSK